MPRPYASSRTVRRHSAVLRPGDRRCQVSLPRTRLPRPMTQSPSVSIAREAASLAKSHRYRSSTSPRLSACAPERGLLHDPQQVSAQDLRDVALRVAPFQKLAGDLRELRRILHPQGHDRAIEVRPQSYVIDSGNLHRVFDVIDDLDPGDGGHLPVAHRFVVDPTPVEDQARLVLAALLRCPIQLRL